jgi:hypothetical protein
MKIPFDVFDALTLIGLLLVVAGIAMLSIPASRYRDLDGRDHVRMAVVLTEAGLQRFMESGFLWLDFRAPTFPPFALYAGEPGELGDL